MNTTRVSPNILAIKILISLNFSLTTCKATCEAELLELAKRTEPPRASANDTRPDDLVIRESWAPTKFTDPRHHNPENFTYLVRVGRLDLNSNFQSASVISDEFTQTYMNGWAYILEVPEENMIASCPKDTGLTSSTSERALRSEDQLLRLASIYSLQAPRRLIAQSIAHVAQDQSMRKRARLSPLTSNCNEVFFRPLQSTLGRTNCAKIIGIAYFADRHTSTGIPQSTEAKIEAQRLGVPAIAIPIVAL